LLLLPTYRVKSVEVDQVKVMLIDYGTETSLAISDLRRLKDRFTSLKSMSFRCVLEGWETPAGREEDDDSVFTKKFNQLVSDRKLLADVVSMTAEHDGVVSADEASRHGEHPVTIDKLLLKVIDVFSRVWFSPGKKTCFSCLRGSSQQNTCFKLACCEKYSKMLITLMLAI